MNDLSTPGKELSSESCLQVDYIINVPNNQIRNTLTPDGDSTPLALTEAQETIGVPDLPLRPVCVKCIIPQFIAGRWPAGLLCRQDSFP